MIRRMAGSLAVTVVLLLTVIVAARGYAGSTGTQPVQTPAAGASTATPASAATPALPPPTPTARNVPVQTGAQSTAWYVDASVAQSGDGTSPATAFKTIQEGTDAAGSGDTIHVAAGSYTETVNLPAGVALYGADRRTTVIDGGGAGTVLFPSPNTVITGVTVRNSGPGSFDAGAWISEGPVTIRNSRFTENKQGIFLWCFEATCPEVNVFTNNVFDHNTDWGINTNAPHHFEAINNTVFANGIGLPATRDHQTLVNNVVVDNGTGLYGESGHTPDAHHNLVWGNDTDYRIVSPGTGDVDADPRFADADDRDYSLQLDSPARDAGDPDAAYTDLDGTRNDMGAFGGPHLVDTTPPPIPTVTDRGDVQPFTRTLHAAWTGFDLQSGMRDYQAALGSTPTGTDVVGWTSVGVVMSHTFTGLSLVDGETYYVSVKGQNGMGDWSNVGSSDGVRVDLSADDDVDPPAIEDVTFTSPAHVDAAIPVTAQITDRGEVPHEVASATLHYGYNEPYEQAQVAGVRQDGDTWRFELPPQGESRAGEALHFRLEACDSDESPACATDDNGGEFYRVAISADLTPEPFRVETCPELCDFPAIHDGRVVYEDHRGPGIEIYGTDLDTGTEFQVVHDEPHQHFPVIHGDIVAYTDLRYSTKGLEGTDVFARNLTTGEEFTVTTAPGQQIELAISDRYVVWQDDRNGQSGDDTGQQHDIYGYDLTTGSEFVIATGPADQITPDVDGSRVVWSESGDIVGKDLATGEPFTVSTEFPNQLRPVIDGDVVIWEDWRNGNWDIFGYRFSTGEEFPLAVAPDDQTHAELSDELIVWQDRRHGNWDIYVHVRATEEQFPVSRNARKQKWPAVDGTTVVWSDFRELEPHIYGFVYDGAVPTGIDFAIEENPTDLVVGTFPGGVVPLTWQDNTDAETDYVIERLTGLEGTQYEELVRLPANTEAFTDTETAVGTPYWYRVYAVNDEGRSAASNESYNLALPAEPYPTEQERYMQVLINEVRADPATFGYPGYDVVPPVVYNPNLNYAARAHATVSALPAGSGGHVDWADRGPGERAVASGYVHGFVSENMGSGGTTAADVAGANAGFLHSDGHRDNMLVAGTVETGLGYHYLWADRRGSWVETFAGRDGLTIPHLPAGAVAPFEGRPGDAFGFAVNYYHPDGLAPTSIQVVVDGVAHALTRETGSAGNATYRYTTTLSTTGDHNYYFDVTFPGGSARLPETGTFTGPTVLPDAPDVDVRSVDVPDATLTTGTATSVTAWIHNAGTVDAGAVRVRFYLGDPAEGGTPIGEDTIALNADRGNRAAITWVPNVAGTYYVYAVADPDDSLSEWHEENNVRRTLVTVVGSVDYGFSTFVPLIQR